MFGTQEANISTRPTVNPKELQLLAFGSEIAHNRWEGDDISDKDKKEGQLSGCLVSTLPNALQAVFITRSFDTL